MNKELHRATMEGNTDSLLNLLQQDELILDRTTSTTPLLETPLHIAALLGHEQFATQLLSRKPQLALELDSRRSSALHLAAAKGHVGIVKALLRVNPEACFVCDRDGYNPVHVAAVRGRIEALREMLQVKPDAARALVKMERTVLHLCVEYCQFEALKVLLESVDFGDLVNCRDGNGNAVLHLAVADKQVETTNLLLSIPGIEVNALNLSGMTAMDILIERRRDVRDSEMEKSLKLSHHNNHSRPPILVHQNMENLQGKFWKKFLKNQDDWLDKKKSALMVVASLIATMAFQVGVDPPENVFQKTNSVGIHASNSQGAEYYLTIMYDYLKKYAQFYMVNTLSFIASLSIIFLLMSGLPIRRKFFMWILMLITWVAITAIALTYTVTLILLTPTGQENSSITVIGITVFVWICLMALLLIGHTIRLFVKTIKMLVKPCFGRRKVPDYVV